MLRILKIILLLFLLQSPIYAFSQISSVTVGNNTTFTISNLNAITLHAASDSAAAYQWYQNGISINGALSRDLAVTTNGVYSVLAFNSQGCQSPQSDVVTVIFTSLATPTLKPDSIDLMTTINSSNANAGLGTIYSYNLSAINNSGGTGSNIKVKYTIPSNLSYISETSDYGSVTFNDTTRMLVWNIDSLSKDQSKNLSVSVKINLPGLIVSTVSIAGAQYDPNEQNNTATTEQQVGSLKVPNVFTPNGDGVNDAFVIPGLESFPENELHIMNRWGSEIYARKNYKNDWTGQGLVEGTYFYVLKTMSSSGTWEVNKGYLTLLRSKI
ncbi:T9SS type B sorting domain-containing protein [Mucilaginibacter sp.]